MDSRVPLRKKQLVWLVWLVTQLKENRYPNCSRFSEVMRQAALDEKLNVACTSKTIFRDIQSFKNDFDAPVRFDRVRNGYYLAHHGWNFSCLPIHDDSDMLAAVLGARVTEHIFPASKALVFFDGIWYAKGDCHTCKEMCTLVLARMKSVVSTGKHFDFVLEIIRTANENGIFDAEMMEDVIVHCDDYLAKFILTRTLHPGHKVNPKPDGSCELHVKRMAKYHLFTWVMHQCGRVTVVRPQNIAGEIIGLANEIIQNQKYGDSSK